MSEILPGGGGGAHRIACIRELSLFTQSIQALFGMQTLAAQHIGVLLHGKAQDVDIVLPRRLGGTPAELNDGPGHFDLVGIDHGSMLFSPLYVLASTSPTTAQQRTPAVSQTANVKAAGISTGRGPLFEGRIEGSLPPTESKGMRLFLIATKPIYTNTYVNNSDMTQEQH